MWRMFVGLTNISWAVPVTLAMACTVAVDGHTCFLFVTAATNTYIESSIIPGVTMS